MKEKWKENLCRIMIYLLIVYLLNFNVDISIYIFVIFVLCNKSIFDLFGKFVFFKFIENKKLYGKI